MDIGLQALKARPSQALTTIDSRVLSTDSQGPKDTVKITSYNIERGLNIDELISMWKDSPLLSSDIVLLSEVDYGMARTKNRNIAEEFAEKLGFTSYAYAVEFIEQTKGIGKEVKSKGENTLGYHGNAIVSKYPISNEQLVRLDNHYNWEHSKEKRLGSRIALIADIASSKFYFTIASVHLENNTSPENRARQMKQVVSAISKRQSASQPTTIIGGDMNACGLDMSRLLKDAFYKSSYLPDMLKHPEKYEPLFKMMAEQGYDFNSANVIGEYTNDFREEFLGFKKSVIESHPDWFFVKVDKKNSRHAISNPVVHTDFKSRQYISDHLPISVEIRLF